MRGTIGDVWRIDGYGLRDWWEDWPGRQGYMWRDLLFEPGAGWLRWKVGERSQVWYDPPDYEQWTVAPPLRRVAMFARCYLAAPYNMVRHRLSFCEVTCSWSDLEYMHDKERKGRWHR